MERELMNHRSRRLPGILLLTLPTLVRDRVSVLSLLINDPTYRGNPVAPGPCGGGQAHAGVLLVLALLLVLRHLDEATPSGPGTGGSCSRSPLPLAGARRRGDRDLRIHHRLTVTSSPTDVESTTARPEPLTSSIDRPAATMLVLGINAAADGASS
jgi:hypothetical protein